MPESVKDPASSSSTPETADKLTPIGKYRWVICALLFFATTINYMDRSVLGVLGPTLRDKVFHWTTEQYSWITISFQSAYAIGLLLMGGIIDRIGVRLGYVVAIGLWSIFGILHATIRPAFSLAGFMIARFGLGFGEAGNFPACIKTVAEWFPKRERALATGIFNAGTNVGAVLTPLVIPFIVGPDGSHWQIAFLITGTFSIIWVITWLRVYRPPQEHPRLSRAEFNYIHSDSTEESVDKKQALSLIKGIVSILRSWGRVIPLKETWAFAIGKTTDAVWWFYLFWGGFFFADKFHLDIKQLGLPLVVIYVGADVGSVLGGWLSGAFMKRGWPLNKARKMTLLVCALSIMPVAFATASNNQWIAVALIALGAAGHQAWSANLFTFVSDIFPKKATASVVGFGGMIGSAVSLLANLTLGKILKAGEGTGYSSAFIVAGSLYLSVLLIMHLITPKMVPLDADLKPSGVRQ
jgi:ACS family hexuronate transporter-like MFS transporter